MRKRLLIAALCMFALPLLASDIHKRQMPAPINMTAMAGHTLSGTFCEGGEGCMDDLIGVPPPPPPKTSVPPPDPTGPPDAPPTGDLSVSLLFAALLVALLLRISI
jgi:hypothetical protein